MKSLRIDISSRIKRIYPRRWRGPRIRKQQHRSALYGCRQAKRHGNCWGHHVCERCNRTPVVGGQAHTNSQPKVTIHCHQPHSCQDTRPCPHVKDRPLGSDRFARIHRRGLGLMRGASYALAVARYAVFEDRAINCGPRELLGCAHIGIEAVEQSDGHSRVLENCPTHGHGQGRRTHWNMCCMWHLHDSCHGNHNTNYQDFFASS